MSGSYVVNLNFKMSRLVVRLSNSEIFSGITRKLVIKKDSLIKQLICVNKANYFSQTRKFTVLVILSGGNSLSYFSSTAISSSNRQCLSIAILKKNLHRTIYLHVLKNFRMRTMAIEVLPLLNRASRIEILNISLDPGSLVE